MRPLVIRPLSIIILVMSVSLTKNSQAQDARTAVGNNFIAVGVGAAPEFIGSEDLEIVPFVAANYETQIVDFSIEGPSLRFDFLGPQTSRVFQAGPVIALRGGRDDVDDEVIDQLQDIDDAFEVGGFAGFSLKDFVTQQDEFYARIEVKGDVSDSHNGFTITPSAGYSAPVTSRLRASFDLSLDYGSREFNETFFNVSAVESNVTGLDSFEADAGFYAVTLGLGLSYAITDNWGVISRLGYTRLSGDAEDSPIVDRGSENQFFVGAGVSYRF
ncbi:MAG: MipA/OmpV family protein [Pseudomonadota bacterium]